MYLGFIIVGCIQLGATIDYSILLTGNYLDARTQGDKKEAAIRAVSMSAESVMTSGMIVMTVAYGLFFAHLGRGGVRPGATDRPRRADLHDPCAVPAADVPDAVRPLDHKAGLRRKKRTPR